MLLLAVKDHIACLRLSLPHGKHRFNPPSRLVLLRRADGFLVATVDVPGRLLTAGTRFWSAWMDVVDARTRSRMMAGIRSKDTKPEMAVRKVAHALGYRYRLHRRDLPGTPDLVFPKFRAAIQVHGCFWHRHEGCRFCTTPASNGEFWQEKFRRNVERDRNAEAALEARGWRTMIVWECQTRDPVFLEAGLRQFLGEPSQPAVTKPPFVSSPETT